MMGYEQFKTELHSRVQKEMGNCAKVQFVMVRKNNQVDWEELSCEMPGRNATPAIPLKEFYNRYLEKGMEWCVCVTVNVFETGDSVSKEELFQTWDAVKGKIWIELVNHAWNGETLETVPHRDFLDLAFIFRVRMCENKYVSAGYTVTREMMDYWGIGMEELCNQAFHNLYQEEQFEMVNLMEETRQFIGIECGEDAEEEDIEDNDMNCIFIFTNRSRAKGAVGMLRTDLLADFAGEQGCDLLILPSSIHELLLVPDHGNYNIEALQEMVRTVNREAVTEEERLSDEIYIYRRNSKKVDVLV